MIILYFNKLKSNIEGEEYENNIHLINNDDNIKSINFDFIVLYHLLSYNYLEEKLIKFKTFIDDEHKNNTLIYLFCTLSNENESIILFKNKLRNNFKKYIKFEFGNVLYLTKVLEIIDNLNYNLNTINKFKKSNYFLYGDNIIYSLQITLK